ncbi:MAG: hypothetical protein RLO51_11035 [Thalassobaculum sp.]|uniref:hypothetical protein n=1 Tax=Thalassobaculum sp. TaxID=2022740 RepID=UPI0032EC6967
MRFELSQLDLLGVGISSAVLGGGIGWCASSPGYEPALAILAGLAGLVQCLASINRQRVVPADRQRFGRLAGLVLPGLDFIKKHDFEGSFLDWRLEPIREFRKVADDTANRFSDPVLDGYRKTALDECSNFIFTVANYTFLLKDDVRGGDGWFKSHDNAEFVRRGVLMNELASKAWTALDQFVSEGSRRFPDLDLHPVRDDANEDER